MGANPSYRNPDTGKQRTVLYFPGNQIEAAREQLSARGIQIIMRAHAQMLGHTPATARTFCANIDEYLVIPKYFMMYEAGRSAIAQSQNDPDGKPGVVGAMDSWNELAAPTVKNDKEFVAVLFTDMVGSMAMTQERGDDAAQLVVHEHDLIVRDALAQYGGREIKHTGDGIMAVFPQIVGAVEGAIAMQRACQRANAADSTLGLGLCVAINAGEPIHEDGDVFGTPVQMAARILGQTDGAEIAVSSIVREVSVGKQYAFTKKGDYQVKGYPEPVPIFLLDWKSSAEATGAADTPSEIRTSAG